MKTGNFRENWWLSYENRESHNQNCNENQTENQTMLKSGIFHDIRWISWNQADFMKSDSFHEIMWKTTTKTTMKSAMKTTMKTTMKTIMKTAMKTILKTTMKTTTYLVSLATALYERPGQSEWSVLNHLFFKDFSCFSYENHKNHLYKNGQFSNGIKISTFIHITKSERHIHAPHTHICTTKIKTYLVGLPSALYERSGQSEWSVLNQLFLRISVYFHMKTMKTVSFHRIHRIIAGFHENCTFSYWISRILLDFNRNERPLARNGFPYVFILPFVLKKTFNHIYTAKNTQNFYNVAFPSPSLYVRGLVGRPNAITIIF